MTNSSASRRERASKMMRRYLGAAFALCLMGVPTHDTFAQQEPAPVILIVDMQRIQRESAAATSIREQSAALRVEIEKTVSERAKIISAEEEELAELRARMTTAEFQERVRAFEQKVFANRDFAQGETAKLQAALADASNRLRGEIAPILAAVMRERKAQVMLDSGEVVLSLDGLDITNEVISRLDEAVPEMTLVLGGAEN